MNNIKWAPFGKGWFGCPHERLYEVSYKVAKGNQRAATLKTNLFSGVYSTDDTVIRKSQETLEEGNEAQRLKDENAMLREELRRLNEGEDV